MLNLSSIEEGEKMLSEFDPPTDERLERYTKLIQKAYNPANKLNASLVLE